MKVTRHFQERLQSNRPYIELAWVAQVIEQPAQRETQPDGRIRFWGSVPYPSHDDPHISRVVTLADGETGLTAFIDSGFRLRAGGPGDTRQHQLALQMGLPLRRNNQRALQRGREHRGQHLPRSAGFQPLRRDHIPSTRSIRKREDGTERRAGENTRSH